MAGQHFLTLVCPLCLPQGESGERQPLGDEVQSCTDSPCHSPLPGEGSKAAALVAPWLESMLLHEAVAVLSVHKGKGKKECDRGLYLEMLLFFRYF